MSIYDKLCIYGILHIYLYFINEYLKLDLDL